MAGRDSAENANLYKALSTPVRRHLLELIEKKGPIDLKGLTAESSMKETTLRHHLLVLERAGLVVAEEGHGGLPGRPPMVYSIPKRHWDLGFPKRQYAVLADKLIAGMIGAQGEGAAIEFMRRTGADNADHILALVAEEKGSKTLEHGDVEKYLLPILDDLGSATTLVEASEDRVVIRMNNCIFYELAVSYAKMVCEGHAALFETFGEALGGLKYQKGSCLAEGDDCCISNLVRENGDPPND